VFAAIAVMATAGAVSGCASLNQNVAERMSQLPAVGLPADAPERPAGPLAYPAVHDIPPPRNSVTLSDFEQRKLEDDLVAARDHQEAALGVKPPAKKKPSPKPAIVPVSSSQTVPASSSSRTIY
jgi:hypothetical protein